MTSPIPDSVMPDETRWELFEIRCRSKRGASLSRSELEYCMECLDKWPEDYVAMESEVFEATRPVGF